MGTELSERAKRQGRVPARDRGARAHGLRCAARPLARARDKPAGWDATGRLRRSEGEGAILTGARRAARDRASTSREETRAHAMHRPSRGVCSRHMRVRQRAVIPGRLVAHAQGVTVSLRM